MGRFGRTSIIVALLGLAFLVPAVVAHVLGYSAAAGALVLPVAVGLVPAILADLRTALLASVGVSLASGLAAATTGNAIAGAAIMAVTALLVGVACRWGHSKVLIVVIITVGFVICQTPAFASAAPRNALILAGATLASSLWGVAVGRVVRLRVPTPGTPALEAWDRTWAYAITIAVLTGIAAFVSVNVNWGHEGAWFILTVVVVFQPYLQDSFQRTWQRTAGTILGLLIASTIHELIPWQTLIVIIGMILMLVATYLLMNPANPYWLFASFLTPAIVLLTASPTNFESTAAARLFATLAGVGLAILAEALLTPLYRSAAHRHGHTRY